MIKAGTVEVDLAWVAFGDHGAMGFTVSGQQLRDGFLRDLYSLMGRRGDLVHGRDMGRAFIY